MGELTSLAEQVGVRTRASEVKLLPINAVHDQPIRLDVRFPESPPSTSQRMIAMLRKERAAGS